MMSRAIITLTKGGMELGFKLLDHMEDTELYTQEKFYMEHKKVKKIEHKFLEFVGKIFTKYDALIFIMATGIVVRSIAPYIKDKKTDPAVIVLDEKGKNVISLLSGHIGGANAMALQIGEILKANPVITTASDINDTIAVDIMAMKLNCHIENYDQATKVTAHIVNKERILLDSCITTDLTLPHNIIAGKTKDLYSNEYKGIILITDQRTVEKTNWDRVILRPKNIVLGVGCKKGKTSEEILTAINTIMEELNISPKCIKHIATVDAKKYEEGLNQAAKQLEVPLVIIERDKIKEIEEEFEISPFVKKILGVGAVCEPVALLSSNKGKIIQKKKSYEGITIAVVREEE